MRLCKTTFLSLTHRCGGPPSPAVRGRDWGAIVPFALIFLTIYVEGNPSPSLRGRGDREAVGEGGFPLAAHLTKVLKTQVNDSLIRKQPVWILFMHSGSFLGGRRTGTPSPTAAAVPPPPRSGGGIGAHSFPRTVFIPARENISFFNS